MARLVLGEHDLHLLFDRSRERLKLFRADGTELFACECRNRTVVPFGFGHWGQCPPGHFRLGRPVPVGEPAFGRWFVPVLDVALSGPMKLFNRRGIGLHGGGRCARSRWAKAQQGWCATHGCLRLQNEDLERLVAVLVPVYREGHEAYLTVLGR